MILPGLGGAIAGISGSTKSVTYKTHLISSSTSGSVTFASGQDIGTAASDRIVVCPVSWGSNSGTSGTISMTIGGITATKVAESGNDGEINSVTFYAVVPTGTTANIVATFTGLHASQSCGVYILYGFSSTPVSSYSNEATGPTLTSSLSPSASQVVIGAAACQVSTSTFTASTNVTISHQQAVAAQDAEVVFFTNLVSASNVAITGGAPAVCTSMTMWG